MPTRQKQKNLALEAACQVELKDALTAWKDSGYGAKEHVALKAVYEKCSEFSPDCPVCIAGRAEFMASLKVLAGGDVTEGLAKMKNAFGTVRFKWSMMREGLQDG